MFERFASPFQVVRAIESGDTPALLKLIRGGCYLDRRDTYDPWKTPLDAAVTSGRIDVVKILLEAGVKIVGSSVIEALLRDDAEVLRLFHENDPMFLRRFHADDEHIVTPHNTNPRLNRWTYHFSALDYALALNSQHCAEFFASIGLKPRASKRCLHSHHAVLIQDEEPYRGGMDNLWVTTEGYYCVRCEGFIK